jgi:GH43 family beta-xylosidase
MKKIITAVLILSILFACSCTSKPAETETEPEQSTAAVTEEITETETETETEAEETEPVKTFRNPISDKSMPDPFIVYHDGYYYGLATEVPTVTLYRSRTVEDLFISGESKVLIKCGDDVGGGKTLGWNEWAPEIHYNPKENKWYVYSCACMNGFEFDSMRMYCLESEGDDPFGDYKFKGVTLPDALCIDQTVYYDEDSGELYTAYCSFTGDRGQVIMIADMKTPWQVGDTRTMITYPKYTWEKRGSDGTNDGRVNEGPVFLNHDGQIYLIYSASGCWCEYYCLGMLHYVGKDTSKENFLNPDNWEKSEKAVFAKANKVYAPGHCAFFYSPDGTEVWMSYHGMATRDAGVDGRFAYIQKIDFDENGAPVLGKPLSRDTDIPVPSGQ